MADPYWYDLRPSENDIGLSIYDGYEQRVCFAYGLIAYFAGFFVYISNTFDIST